MEPLENIETALLALGFIIGAIAGALGGYALGRK
jgi:uncharacterized membrane protein YoaK (UPF0700 family)